MNLFQRLKNVFTDELVRYVRSLKGLMSERKLAAELGVGRRCVRNVFLGESYKNVL